MSMGWGLSPGWSLSRDLHLEGLCPGRSPSGGLHPGGLSEEWVVHILLELLSC